MANTQSKIESLEEQISKLIAENNTDMIESWSKNEEGGIKHVIRACRDPSPPSHSKEMAVPAPH
ncbi:hypothetical protein Glove_349g62 [Diversispora epigaea]|uniref:Uncharacterized protein n=1 Tax=Diversispora epigaea TaxID=1348612 RepID=A0A397HDW1_9GLOM|nr:hypothetical protein Glove_349g62 [Diversispora epigaea]